MMSLGWGHVWGWDARVSCMGFGVQRGLSGSSSAPPPALQACGVDYEVKAFCAENLEEKIHKR